MWADTAVPGFAEIAVHAQDLEAWRIALLGQPLVDLPSIHISTVVRTVVIDVI
jgi:hypothetical protein